MLRSRTLLMLLCAAIPLVITQFVEASVTLRLDEAKTRVLLQDERTIVSLALENPTKRSLDGNVRIELIDPNDNIRAIAELQETIARGQSSLTIPIPLQFGLSDQSGRDELLWYRLRYRISPTDASAGDFEKVEGIVSLSEITPDIFDLRVAAPQAARPGLPCRVHVSTLHPISSRPVKDVKVDASIEFWMDSESRTVTATGLTNAEGFATLDFDLPRNIDRDDDDLDLEVTARRGEFMREADDDIDLDVNSHVLITTDKPLYQPGQTLHMRALIFDSANRALPNEEVSFVVQDQEGSIVYRAAVKTSRFGICNTDWEIPENTRLGDYTIRVEMENSDDDWRSAQTIKISRYDLPNFTVQVKPDQPYYLSGQKAEVEIRADYLFGQPVKRGHVRVVREVSRRWDYQKQIYVTDEADKYEGEADAEGRFIAHINLQKQHDELARNDYERFDDLTYAAYFTDPTTNRTEQRRFDLRLSRDAIHIYINDDATRQAANLPLEFYLSTFYADGTPAECDVTISDNTKRKQNSYASQHAGPAETLRTIRTNRYGVAKLSGLSLAGRDGSESEAVLSFTAHDKKGIEGHQSNTFTFSDDPVLRVETDKIIYRPGDPIHAQVTSNDPNMSAVVNVWRHGVNLHSEIVRFSSGHASFTMPFNAELKDDVTIVAYPISPVTYSRYDLPTGSRTVLFPSKGDLKLSVQLDQKSYRPGQDAVADFSIRTPDGRVVESALGIVIYDRAVEERARTDSEFSGSYGYYSAYRNLRGDRELSGVSLQDLKRLDMSKPIPRDLELVAEMLLGGDSYAPVFFGSEDYATDQRRIFTNSIESRTWPLKNALVARFESRTEYPTNEESLRRMLTEGGVQWDTVRDPWEMNFRAEFSTEREQDVLLVNSAGPDKRFGTSDDFTAAKMSWPYFTRTGEVFNRAAEKYHTRTGNYIRDDVTFGAELAREGLDLNTLRDRWGHSYNFQFAVKGFYYTLDARSSGPNGKFETPAQAMSDDFTVWTVFTDYFASQRSTIDEALTIVFKSTGSFPQNESELREALKGTNLSVSGLRDLWGRDYYFNFSNEKWLPHGFSESDYYVYNDAASKGVTSSLLKQNFNYLRISSRGADGQERTGDDFVVAGFSRNQVADAARNLGIDPNASIQTSPGSTGAITGTIIDPNGAVVAGANVKVTRVNVSRASETNAEVLPQYTRETTCNDEGVYLVANLPVGFYKLEISSAGFQTFQVDNVPIKSSSLTKVDGTLYVAGTSAMVSVQSELPLISTSMSAMSLMTNTFSAEFGRNSGAVVQISMKSTPRLREYFPETLLWQPSLETDAEGRARLNFKLADNITTWKMSVISSTVDGEIGLAEEEIRAFQPFFVEHDPPRVLTEGDQIQLPVVLRNYLEKAQTVNVEIKPESWFTLLGPAQKSETVAAGDATRSIFAFRAVSSIKDGKQRITATSAEANDAIEKPISVHPDGQEMSLASSYLMTDTATLNVNFPDETISGSAKAELKIYPNLMAHVIESIEGIMQRPYGCGEQTISSTYPSLLALKAYKRSGLTSTAQSKAERYLQQGYERLLNYRAAGGGFNYWGHGEADLALTTYALRFLNDAREFITVDDELISSTRTWLIKQQRPDGSWAAKHYWSSTEDTKRTPMLTAYIARELATHEPDSVTAAKELQPTPLTMALDYLKQRVNQLNEPYLVSVYVLASLEAKDSNRAAQAVAKLQSLAKSEDNMTSWSSETGTPFYGWGLTERIETTALAVQALEMFDRVDGAAASDSKNAELAGSGVLYLLSRKDRYGVWHSTQATVNVLDALISSIGNHNSSRASSADSKSQSSEDEAEILVNGQHAITVKLPPASQLSGPLQIDLSKYIAPRNNLVSIRRKNATGQAAVQVVQSYYLPWNSQLLTTNVSAESRALRLDVSYDKTEFETGAEVTCRVQAQRVGTSGHGMLLAEIGLPPGADVDRASLEKAVKESNWSLSRYDVLPDRLIVYLWPRNEGTRFEFKFRPRFGLTAQSAPSVIYDYYNPEARAVVAPTKFIVR